jgi:hypothetical protein
LGIAVTTFASALVASSSFAADTNSGFRGKGAEGVAQLAQISRQTGNIQHFQKNQEFKSGAWLKSDHHFEVPGEPKRVWARRAVGSTVPARLVDPESRQKLVIKDPNNPSEVASGLRNRYQKQSEFERRNAHGKGTSSLKLTCPTCAPTKK